MLCKKELCMKINVNIGVLNSKTAETTSEANIIGMTTCNTLRCSFIFTYLTPADSA